MRKTILLTPIKYLLLSSCAYSDRENTEERAYMIGCTFNGLLSNLPGHEEYCNCSYYYGEELGYSEESTDQLCLK